MDLLQKLQHKYIYLLYAALGVLLFYYSLVYKRTKIVPFYLIVLFVIFIFTCYLSLKKMKIEKLFLWLYLSVGIIYVFTMPMFKVPDEAAHFMRAYEVSEGVFLSQGNMPDNITLGIEEGNSTLQLYKEQGQTVLSDQRSNVVMPAAQYSPISYIPQAIGICIARMFTSRILVMAYVARLVNFLIATVLFYYAIKIIPAGKNLLLCIAMLPIMLQQSASMNIDGVMTALIMNVVAVVLYERSTSTGIMRRSRIGYLFLLGILLGQYKNIYVSVCLLYLFIPKEKFGNGIRKIIYAVSLVAVVCITMFGWMYMAGTLGTFQQGISASIQNGGIDYNAAYASANETQLAVTPESIGFGRVMINTIRTYGRMYMASSLGETLGYFDINPDQKVIYLFLLLLLYTGLLERKEKIRLGIGIRITMIIAALITSLGVFLAIYVMWSGTALDTIVGVQGRYFTPLFVLLFLAFTNRKRNIPVVSANILIPMLCVLNLCALSTVFFTCLY